MVRAYAATLIPGPDGCARIDSEAALRWMRATGGKWSLAGRDASEQRRNLLAAMANLARKGDLDKREGAAIYRTWRPGYEGAPIP